MGGGQGNMLPKNQTPWSLVLAATKHVAQRLLVSVDAIMRLKGKVLDS